MQEWQNTAPMQRRPPGHGAAGTPARLVRACRHEGATDRLFLRPGLAAAPEAAPARAGSGREAERVRPHLPVLREGHVRHGLASLAVPDHLGDRACHVCKAKHTRDEARPGRSSEGVPVRATAAPAGPALTSGQAHSVRAGHGLPVREQPRLPLRVVLAVAAVPVGGRGLLAQLLQVLQRDARHRVRRERDGGRPGAAQRATLRGGERPLALRRTVAPLSPRQAAPAPPRIPPPPPRPPQAEPRSLLGSVLFNKIKYSDHPAGDRRPGGMGHSRRCPGPGTAPPPRGGDSTWRACVTGTEHAATGAAGPGEQQRSMRAGCGARTS